ncbi:hypothetical protein MNBD_DELTA03-1096 [hydrothermal vent metagenome]|uniref:Uncharacterized protein n=1 Tax=hydrothermal vent metagenome TaxID=652676 RepID=A0A3B0V3R3_9ZZZZ
MPTKDMDKSYQGHISGISLTSFLQLIELDRKTCTLRLTSGNRRGSLYFVNGELWDAQSEDECGAETAMRIISWRQVIIDIEEGCPLTVRNIDLPLGFMLIEGVRRGDEEQETAPQRGKINLDMGVNKLLPPILSRISRLPAVQTALIVLPDKIIKHKSGPLNTESWHRIGSFVLQMLQTTEDGILDMEIRLRGSLLLIRPLSPEAALIVATKPSLNLVLINANLKFLNAELQAALRGEAQARKTTRQPGSVPLVHRLKHLEDAMTEIIGPLAHEIFQAGVADWQLAGPAATGRLQELIDLLCMEIGDPQLEEHFRGAAGPIIESAPSEAQS